MRVGMHDMNLNCTFVCGMYLHYRVPVACRCVYMYISVFANTLNSFAAVTRPSETREAEHSMKKSSLGQARRCTVQCSRISADLSHVQALQLAVLDFELLSLWIRRRV